MVDTWSILSPVAPATAVQPDGETHALNRPISGVRFGLRVDFAWRSFKILVDEWSLLLEADGAHAHPLWVEHDRGETRQYNPGDLRNDVDDWSRLVDCGLAGLGN